MAGHLYVMCGEMRLGLRLVYTIAALLSAGPLIAADDAPLTATEIQSAVVLDEVSLPTPGEFFAAINKLDRPNWSQLAARKPGSLATTNRAQTSLNLGTRVADGFIAVEAQDGQQVKNVGKDIIDLAKGLGVSQSILARGNSIGDFAENNDWSALKEELDATENEVKHQMAAQQDNELVVLVTTGAWLRGIQAASSVISANYQPESARLLRQPAIVEYLIARMDALPDRLKNDPLAGKVRKGLLEIKAAVAPPTPPSADTVKTIQQTSTQLVNAISGPATPAQ
ncbi:MAG: hypothetical protein PHC88_02710 [Terrimicrobiaceae bacterium]|nr:hypothetical protein [Terrimicrobiaceae bacterium]